MKKALIALAIIALLSAGCDLGYKAEQVQDIDLGTPQTPTRNIGTNAPFADFLGKSSVEMTTKYLLAYAQWYKTVYVEEPKDPSMAYIWDNYSKGIRTEGMSYGMMIFVQLNDKTRFAKLWKFAKKYMQFKAIDGIGDGYEGFFQWQVEPDGKGGYKQKDGKGMAPDGELYFAMSLIFAYNRWGVAEYKTDATNLIKRMINGISTDDNDTSFFYSNYYVKHWPQNKSSTERTNPSYHVPAFYQKFISFLPSTEQTTKIKYANIRDASRAFLKKCLGQSPYYLPPDVSDKDGVGKIWSADGDGAEFGNDAWRVAMNITLDVDWNGTQWYGHSWVTSYANAFCAFFESKNKDGKVTNRTYADKWNTDGTAYTPNDGHSAGLVAMNAMVSCLTPDYMGMKTMMSKRYMQELWDLDPAKINNYYNVCLYTLAILWATGNYNTY